MATIRKSLSTKKLIANLFLGGGFLSTAIAGQMLLPELSQHPKTPQSFFYLFIPMIIGFHWTQSHAAFHQMSGL